MHAQWEGHIVVNRQIGKQRARLKQHAHAAAQPEQVAAPKLTDFLTINPHLTGTGFQLAADQT